MKSVKRHISLILALFSIVITFQFYTISDRVLNAYESNLNDNYAIILVTDKQIKKNTFTSISSMIKDVEEISTKKVIERLQSQMKQRHIDLLKLTLPHFYSIKLDHFAKPDEVKKLRKKLLNTRHVTRVEDFAQNHDALYQLLLLFKSVIILFVITIFSLTTLLIAKEMRIWQFQHNERMSIMAMFGAPVWMRSSILFKDAIIDAIIASALAYVTFTLLSFYKVAQYQLQNIGVNITLFDPIQDGMILIGIALTLAMLLSVFIVIAHKEEA